MQLCQRAKKKFRSYVVNCKYIISIYIIHSKQENKNYRKFESDLRRLGITEKCDIVLSWTKRIMKDWDEELEHYSEKYRNTAEGTMKLGDYRHCSRNIKPLFKQLQKEV